PFRARAASPAPGPLGDVARQLRSGVARPSRKEDMLRPDLNQEAARSPTSSAAALRPGERAAARKPAPLPPPPPPSSLSSTSWQTRASTVAAPRSERRRSVEKTKDEPDASSYNAGLRVASGSQTMHLTARSGMVKVEPNAVSYSPLRIRRWRPSWWPSKVERDTVSHSAAIRACYIGRQMPRLTARGGRRSWNPTLESEANLV
ncbi:unnamed protein product, partial [Prorocentrum cordatum]